LAVVAGKTYLLCSERPLPLPLGAAYLARRIKMKAQRAAVIKNNLEMHDPKDLEANFLLPFLLTSRFFSLCIAFKVYVLFLNSFWA
jgi:hypothetical protein